jgi:hypothetical protein
MTASLREGGHDGDAPGNMNIAGQRVGAEGRALRKGLFIALAVAVCAGAILSAAGRRAGRQVLPVPGADHQRLVLRDGDVWLETSGRRRSLGLARYRPWKLGWARVAGQRQLAVAVYKSTRFEPQPHNALFLYDWNEGRISPRWLGSRLSKPFTDFAFVDMRGRGETELTSVERLKDGRSCIVIYRWTGFGFQGEWQSPPRDRIWGLNPQGRLAVAQAETKGKRQPIRVGWLGNGYGELTHKGKNR